MSTVHFVFPTMAGKYRVSLYGIGAPATPTLLYSIAKRIKFGKFNDGRCWDTSIHMEDHLLSEIRSGDLVCMTATVSGYPVAISLLERARKQGAKTAIGGPWVSARAKEIFSRRPWIDYIVCGEGEHAIKSILRGSVKPGLIKGSRFALENHTPPDFSGWTKDDLHLFNRNYHEMISSGTYGPVPEIIPAFVFYQSTRGCIQRPRCAFCGVRLGEKLDWRSAEDFYGDINTIMCQYADINPYVHIFDTSDSFVSVIGRFCCDFHSHKGVTLTVFSRVDEVNPRSADALRELGVTKVSLGIECGSDQQLSKMGKQTTTRQNKEAVQILADTGISVYMNFMYGLPGDTVESINRTVDHCLELCAIGNVYRAKGRITTPLPGSRWFRELIRGHPEVDDGSDWLSPQGLGLAWLKYRTKVTLDDIQAANARFTAAAGKMGVTYSSETAVWFG